jgi:hypothetical protein
MLQAVDYQLRHRLQRPCVSGTRFIPTSINSISWTPPF